MFKPVRESSGNPAPTIPLSRPSSLASLIFGSRPELQEKGDDYRRPLSKRPASQEQKTSKQNKRTAVVDFSVVSVSKNQKILKLIFSPEASKSSDQDFVFLT